MRCRTNEINTSGPSSKGYYPSLKEIEAYPAWLIKVIDEIFENRLNPPEVIVHFGTTNETWVKALGLYAEDIACVLEKRWEAGAEEWMQKSNQGQQNWYDAIPYYAPDMVRLLYTQLEHDQLLPAPFPTPTMMQSLPTMFQTIHAPIQEVSSVSLLY